MDIIFVLIWPIAAAWISFTVKAGFWTSLILFLGIPALYLSIKSAKFIPKTALFAAILSLPVGIVFDYVMERTGGWLLTNSFFGNFRLFNYVVPDQVIWLFLYIYLAVMFYKTYLDPLQSAPIFNPKIKKLFIGGLILLGLFLFIYFVNPKFLAINYFYLKFGSAAALIPILSGLFRFPLLCGKFFQANLYFIFLNLTYELTALSLNQWSFPNENQFIGFVKIFNIQFPFEEFIFWILLSAIALFSYYEIFAEDRR